MCGRFLFGIALEELLGIFKIQGHKTVEMPHGEVFPSNTAPVIFVHAGTTEIALMKWGLSGYEKNQLLINARSETLLQKRRFSNLMESQRCVIPASAFYEWERKGPEKSRHTFGAEGYLMFAGLYEKTPEGNAFTILTMESSGDVAKIHGRMPIALDEPALLRWIDPGVRASEAMLLIHEQQPSYRLLDGPMQLSFF